MDFTHPYARMRVSSPRCEVSFTDGKMPFPELEGLGPVQLVTLGDTTCFRLLDSDAERFNDFIRDVGMLQLYGATPSIVLAKDTTATDVPKRVLMYGPPCMIVMAVADRETPVPVWPSVTPFNDASLKFPDDWRLMVYTDLERNSPFVAATSWLYLQPTAVEYHTPLIHYNIDVNTDTWDDVNLETIQPFRYHKDTVRVMLRFRNAAKCQGQGSYEEDKVAITADKLRAVLKRAMGHLDLGIILLVNGLVQGEYGVVPSPEIGDVGEFIRRTLTGMWLSNRSLSWSGREMEADELGGTIAEYAYKDSNFCLS